MPRPIFDGHLDLAMNALAYDRDQTWPVAALRQREAALEEPDRGGATVSLPALRQAGVGWCVGTLFARAHPQPAPAHTPLRTDEDAATQAIAHAAAMGQLAYYRLLERQGQLRIVTQADDLAPPSVPTSPQSTNRKPQSAIRLLLLIEGADPITHPDESEFWFAQGVRGVSLAHSAPSAYAVGNAGDGALTNAGRDLLTWLADLGMALDTSHLCDRSFHEALDLFDGPVLASHTNCRALVPGPRQFADDQLKRLVQRDGVIGLVVHNAMLQAGWTYGKSSRQDVGLAAVVMHLDHICQLAGDARHAALGSDLDGGFGVERCPHDLDTIADLQKLAPLLAQRGYGESDIDAILCGNWRRFWGGVLRR